MSLKQIHTPHIYICSISRIVRFEIFNKSSIYSNAIYPDISDTISIQISGYLGTKCAIYSNTIYPDISDTIYPASISDTMQVDEQPSEASVFGEALFNGKINLNLIIKC